MFVGVIHHPDAFFGPLDSFDHRGGILTERCSLGKVGLVCEEKYTTLPLTFVS